MPHRRRAKLGFKNKGVNVQYKIIKVNRIIKNFYAFFIKYPNSVNFHMKNISSRCAILITSDINQE